MSHIHNLTSHLKNTTITPTSPPQQTSYQVAPNGLKIYQLSKEPQQNIMQQQQPHRMMYSHSPVDGRKVLPTTPSHLNLNNFHHQQNNNNNAMLQQQLRKPPVLNNNHHAMANFMNNPSQSKGGASKSPVVNRTNNQTVNNHHSNNHPTISRQLSLPPQINSPTKQFTPTKNNNIMNYANNVAASSSSTNKQSSPVQNGRINPVIPSVGAARLLPNQFSQNNEHKSNGLISMIKGLQAKKKNINRALFVPPRPTPPPPPPSIALIVPKVETPSSPKSPNLFKKGDDVLYTTDDGNFMLGTIGMIHGENLQILFGDGTQNLASYLRVKLLAGYVDEPKEDDKLSFKAKNDVKSDTSSNKPSTSTASQFQGNASVKTQKVSNNLSSPDQGGVTTTTNGQALANEEVTCGSCGVVKKVAVKKALCYAPHTKDQYNCRRCLNKSRFSKNSLIPQTSNRKSPNSSSTNKSPSLSHRQSGQTTDKCFHCEKYTNYNDRLHCNLCERDCHLSCLAMTPTPLDGDGFWDVICSSCGTQNGDSGSSGRTKVFSCRRSISSWSDVAHLVLSCLASQPEHAGERFFDLEVDVIPFIDNNLDRLHLPRAYKNIAFESRRTFLSTALHNATLRFINGKDVRKKPTLWAIRENNFQQGYPYHLQKASSTPQKNVAVKQSAPRRVFETNEILTRSCTSPKSSSSKTISISGGSSRTLGQSKSPVRAELTPPKLDRYDTDNRSPGKVKAGSSRVMSQSQSLVQKAKKLMTLPDSNNKRKKSLIEDSLQDAKRIKLDENGLSPSSLKQAVTPIKVTEWLDNMNNISKKKSPGSYDKTAEISPLFGRAVKSAGITPPGTGGRTPEKPALRTRKPKADLKIKDKLDKVKKNGIVATIKLKGRGRPSNAALQKFAQIPVANGAVSKEEEMFNPTEFSTLQSSLQDVSHFASGYSISCLPPPPKTEGDKKALLKLAGQLFAKETFAPPAYLKQLNGARPRPGVKSRRDLKDLDSYEVTAHWLDKNGIVRFYCDWKDGFGNDCDEYDSGPLLSFEDLNNADALWELSDKMDIDGEEENKAVPISCLQNGKSASTSRRNSVIQEQSPVADPIKIEKTVEDKKPQTRVIRLNSFMSCSTRTKEKDSKVVIDLTSDSP